jgi:hypothetical protein
MMHIGSGKRNEWQFPYTAAQVAEGARLQREFRRSRVAWWADEKAKVLAEIRESGLEINESIAATISNYTSQQPGGPQVMIRPELQRKLAECHAKIQSHQQAADEYAGWIDVLKDRPSMSLQLTHMDWLYFFGKR